VPITSVTFTTSDALSLEGRLAVPDGTPAGAVVVCHPHPSYQGSMSSAFVPAVQRALAGRDWIALRFNFRGVGRSEGTYSGGPGEIEDALAALDFVERLAPGAPLAIAGWSFGSLVALHAAVGNPRVATYAGIAPPVSTTPHIEVPREPPPEALASWRARVLVACGTDDPFCHPNAAHAWAASLSADAEVQVFEGADHFFTGKRELIADAVAGFIAGP